MSSEKELIAERLFEYMDANNNGVLEKFELLEFCKEHEVNVAKLNRQLGITDKYEVTRDFFVEQYTSNKLTVLNELVEQLGLGGLADDNGLDDGEEGPRRSCTEESLWSMSQLVLDDDEMPSRAPSFQQGGIARSHSQVGANANANTRTDAASAAAEDEARDPKPTGMPVLPGEEDPQTLLFRVLYEKLRTKQAADGEPPVAERIERVTRILDSLGSSGGQDGCNPGNGSEGGSRKQILKQSGSKHLQGIDPELAQKVLEEIVDRPGSVPISLEDIIGCKAAKAALVEIVIIPSLRPDLFHGVRAPAKGLLLYGPPGNGKTMLAKAVANLVGSAFFSCSASSIASKMSGETEKMIRCIFSCAREIAPTIIFIDEVDSVMGKRGDGDSAHERKAKTELLVQFDGVGTDAGDRLLVMGATNLPMDLDDAALRRFTKRIEIQMPDFDARKAMIRHLLRRVFVSLPVEEMDEIAEATEGYSGSDLTALVMDASMGPLRDLPGAALVDVKAEDIRPIQVQDFLNSLRNIRPSTSQKSLKKYVDWSKKYGSV